MIFTRKLFLLALSILTSSLVLSSCSVLRARPAKKIHFLSHPEKLVELRDRAPFNGVAYLNPERTDFMHANSKNLVVLPVQTKIVEEELKKDISDAKLLHQRLEELEEIGRYFHDRLKFALANYPEYPYKVFDTVVPDSFVVEFALVELVPTKAGVNFLGQVAGFFIPGAGLVGRLASGSIAFEAQIRDGNTNEVLIEFRDREADKTAPFTVRDFQEYAHTRKIIDEWAEQYAELSATSRNHKVADSSPLTLNPL